MKWRACPPTVFSDAQLYRKIIAGAKGLHRRMLASSWSRAALIGRGFGRAERLDSEGLAEGGGAAVEAGEGTVEGRAFLRRKQIGRARTMDPKGGWELRLQPRWSRLPFHFRS